VTARGGYPAFIAELAFPANRSKLWISIGSGYGTALVFGLLAGAAHALTLVPLIWPLYAIVGFKLITNTLSLLTLRRDVLVLEAGGLNVLADLLAMTGAVYFTGAQASPLFAIYLIEISVVALLTNLGTTVLVAGAAFLLYGTMVTLVHAGVLPAMPTPLETTGFTWSYLVTELVVVALLLGTPTFYTAAILRLLREKERALEARNRELVEAGTQKSQFMANITHELRTPIHGICGLSDLVESGVYGPVTDKQVEAQQMIKRSARSLLQLIDDLLELARADAGKLRYAPSDVDLGDLLPSVMATVRWMQGTEERRLDLDVEGDLPVLYTDRGKLNQILINLLSNAVKFTGDGGRITLRARSAGDRGVLLEVEDDGVGIPEAEIDRIFEAFHQVDGSAERQFGGAGLGLALVRRLADVLGATVRVASVQGKGSTFTVVLPLRHEGDTAAA
jgi:signal transduction histidine kinase